MLLKDFKNTKAIIIFDGYCTLCNSLISLLLRLDKKKIFLFANFESSTWKAFSHNLEYSSDSIVLYKDGQFSIQSEAVLRIIETLGYPWKVFIVARIIPFKIREKIYRIIARNRYAIFGKKDNCKIPTPDIKDRFLD